MPDEVTQFADKDLINKGVAGIAISPSNAPAMANMLKAKAPKMPIMTIDADLLDSLIAREGQRVENGLGVLSVVATSSPFIGLFGTVWGIMNAFGRIAAAGNTNLTTVAPAIAEALFATAIGLGAAIPAYIAYNKFSIDAGKFTGRLESFADDLQAAVARRLGGPTAPAPAPQPERRGF